jgi:2-polyprenyl-3-methyl-5-hydroxy-6-metoxy-1,4-benzoquinol methylase
MWNQAFSVEEYIYGETPNDFLNEMTPNLKVGRALCLAAGEGRNAVHLARNGFTVTGVDSSSVGLEKAHKLAEKNNVSIETIVADLGNYNIDKETWDCITSFSCHLPPAIRKKIHKQVVTGLKPGGFFILEAYTPKQLEYGTGGPPTAELMMELETLKVELESLKIIHGKELIRDVIEGTYHTGKASMVQVLAQKI